MHKIRREKRTTISVVVVPGKRNIKQNRNRFYYNFSVESSSFIFNNFKTEKMSLPLKVKTDQFVIFFFFLSKFLAFYPRAVKRIVTALMPSSLFRYFFSFPRSFNNSSQ